MKFTDRLESQFIFFDGGFGTMLQSRGLAAGQPPERLNLEKPELVTDVHMQYLEAGVDVLTLNTFGTLSHKHSDYDSLINAAYKNAMAAVEAVGRDVYIAFDIGPTGKLMKPFGDMEFEECVEIYKKSAKCAAQLGVDIFIAETFSDCYELKAAITAFREVAPHIPFIATVTVDENARTLTGSDFMVITTILESLGVTALGMNCGLGPEQFEALFDKLYATAGVPIIIQPNAGLPQSVDGVTHYDYAPERFGEIMKRLASKGARILGGCCGTTPAHIAQVIKNCKDLKPLTCSSQALNKDSIFCSYQKSCDIETATVSYDLNLNNPDVSKALEKADYEAIAELATEYTDFDMINLDLGKHTARCIPYIQELVRNPLSISSTDEAVTSAALRIYNGKLYVR